MGFVFERRQARIDSRIQADQDTFLISLFVLFFAHS